MGLGAGDAEPVEGEPRAGGEFFDARRDVTAQRVAVKIFERGEYLLRRSGREDEGGVEGGDAAAEAEGKTEFPFTDADMF